MVEVRRRCGCDNELIKHRDGCSMHGNIPRPLGSSRPPCVSAVLVSSSLLSAAVPLPEISVVATLFAIATVSVPVLCSPALLAVAVLVPVTVMVRSFVRNGRGARYSGVAWRGHCKRTRRILAIASEQSRRRAAELKLLSGLFFYVSSPCSIQRAPRDGRSACDQTTGTVLRAARYSLGLVLRAL